MKWFNGLTLLALIAPAAAAQERIAWLPNQTRSELLARNANLDLGPTSVADALAALHQTSGVPIAYSRTLFPGDLKVSCRCTQVTVGLALDFPILHGLPFEVSEHERQVVVKPVFVLGKAGPGAGTHGGRCRHPPRAHQGQRHRVAGA